MDGLASTAHQRDKWPNYHAQPLITSTGIQRVRLQKHIIEKAFYAFLCRAWVALNDHLQNCLCLLSDSAYRQCSANGTWFDSTLQKPYTHYGACPDVDSFKVNWICRHAKALTMPISYSVTIGWSKSTFLAMPSPYFFCSWPSPFSGSFGRKLHFLGGKTSIYYLML